MATSPSKIPSLEASSKKQRVAEGRRIGLAVAALLILLRTTDLFETIELQFVDLRTRAFAGAQAPDPDIVVAQIEESDIDWVRKELGTPWPWPLEYNAYLVGVIREAGARALMVDLLHLDRGAGPDDVPGGGNLSLGDRQQREIEAADAKTYGDALAAFGRAAVGFSLTDAPRYELEARRAAAEERIAGPTDFEIDPAAPTGLARSGADLPVLGVIAGAKALGFTNATPDVDGVVRRATLYGRWGARTVFSLPLQTIHCQVRSGSGARTGDTRLNDDGSFLVDFRSAQLAGVYPRVEPARLLSWAQTLEEAGALPAEAHAALEGKTIVLGINAAGAADLISTPFGTMDGPQFQATVLDNLMNGGARVRQSRLDRILYVLILCFFLGGLGARFEGRWLPHVVFLSGAVLFLGWSFLSFSTHKSLDMFTPLLGIGLTWGGTTALRAMTAGRRNKWLEGTFGRYMAPSIIEALKKDPALLSLGGRETEITVLFSDVANFTSHSARLAARQIVELLNRYLTGHCAAVMAEGGVVDKFEGDAVMAFFGDPVPQEDHATRACRAALAVIEGLPALAPVWRGMGLDEFRIRVGLNTGTAVVGNMGSDQRFDYTCMGDTVNLASRIEGAGKIYGTQILVGAATARAAAATCLFKPLGSLVVIGREAPEPVFELVGLASGADARTEQHLASFAAALAALEADDLDEAEARLTDAEAARRQDGPCAWLRGVLSELRAGALPRPWSGVTQQRTK